MAESREKERQMGKGVRFKEPEGTGSKAVQQARYVKPMPLIDEAFRPKDHRSIKLPSVRTDTRITDEDRRQNEDMIEKLISNRFQRELLIDL